MHVCEALTGLSMWENARMRGGYENSVVQGLGPHGKIVKKDTTNPLNIGDERILGVKPSL